jgi:NAD(P)-dependent dehydrogenase (short-subunit alcohol dehydrogenase family)
MAAGKLLEVSQEIGERTKNRSGISQPRLCEMNNLDRRTFLSGIAAVAASTPVLGGISQLGAGQNSPETTRGTTSLTNGRLQNKVGVVTGAARGIGCAVIVTFARECADIVGLDILHAGGLAFRCSTVDASGFGRNRATSTNGRPPLTSSTQGQHGTKFGASYSVSKWGIIGLMKCAALELGQYSITVNALIPGLIDTPLTRHKQRYAQVLETAGQAPTGLSTAEDEADARKILIARSPLGLPWLEPKDVAPVVVFLASDAVRMVSGATCDVTGGVSANNTA